IRLRLTPGSPAARGAGAPEVVESPEDSAMGPPLGCRRRLAACALGSRGILKRESRQSADQCVQVTILPIEHPEWNTRFASILFGTRAPRRTGAPSFCRDVRFICSSRP